MGTWGRGAGPKGGEQVAGAAGGACARCRDSCVVGGKPGTPCAQLPSAAGYDQGAVGGFTTGVGLAPCRPTIRRNRAAVPSSACLPYRYEYVVDEQLVHAKLDDLLKKQDLSRYVL